MYDSFYKWLIIIIQNDIERTFAIYKILNLLYPESRDQFKLMELKFNSNLEQNRKQEIRKIINKNVLNSFDSMSHAAWLISYDSLIMTHNKFVKLGAN